MLPITFRPPFSDSFCLGKPATPMPPDHPESRSFLLTARVEFCRGCRWGKGLLDLSLARRIYIAVPNPKGGVISSATESCVFQSEGMLRYARERMVGDLRIPYAWRRRSDPKNGSAVA